MSRISLRNQRGVVLVVALIMLLLVTLIAVVTTNSIRTNLQIVQNIEARAAVKNAVVHALEEAIAYGQFPSGSVAFQTSCGNSFQRCFDLSGDGVEDDVTVQLTGLTCKALRPVSIGELNDTDKDIGCLPDSASPEALKPGAPSKCSMVVWEITATGTDEVTGAVVSARQAVNQRVYGGNPCT